MINEDDDGGEWWWWWWATKSEMICRLPRRNTPIIITFIHYLYHLRAWWGVITKKKKIRTRHREFRLWTVFPDFYAFYAFYAFVLIQRARTISLQMMMMMMMMMMIMMMRSSYVSSSLTVSQYLEQSNYVQDCGYGTTASGSCSCQSTCVCVCV